MEARSLGSVAIARSRIVGARGPRRLLFALLALGMLSMPVQYRGGADFAHPHAVFQLWFDAARGTTDHFHMNAMSQAIAGTHTMHATVPERPAEVQTAPPTGPTIAGLTSGVEQAAAIGAALAVAGFVLFGHVALATRTTRVLTGQFLQPEAPPPRLIAAL